MWRQEIPRKAKGKVTVAPGFQLWREVVAEAQDYRGLDVTVVVTWSDEESRLVPSRIEAKQRPGGPAVTSELLRSITVQAFVRHAITASVRDGLTPGGAEDEQARRAFGLITLEQVQECKEAGPTDDTLRWVSLVYRGAVAIGDPPTKSVRETFEISQSTAGAWVSAARRAGHLGEADGPGRAVV